MRLCLKLLILVSLFMHAGCNLSMSEKRKIENILATPSIDESIERRLDSPFFTIDDWPQSDWWENFNSSELDALIELALENNYSILEMQKRVQVAEQESIIVRSKLFPLLTFHAQDIESHLSKHGLYRALNPKLPLNPTLIDLSINFSYELDFWGKNRNFFLAAIGKELSEKAEAAQIRLIITTAVAQTYFALQTNLLRKSLYQQLVNVNKQLIDLQNLMKAKSLSAQIPFLSIEENYYVANQFIYIINEEIALNKHLLNVLIGKGPDTPLDINPFLPPLSERIAIPYNLSIDLLARRPDLMAQIWRAVALSHEVGAAMADFYPDVDFKALLGLESVSWPLLFKKSSVTASMTPAIHLPIFTAGAIQANVDARKAAFDQAVYAYDDLLLKSIQEVVDLLIRAQSIFEQKKEQDLIVQNAKNRLDVASLLLKNGLESFFGVYNTQVEVINREIENANLLYKQYSAVISLIKALGGGYYEPHVPLQLNECTD